LGVTAKAPVDWQKLEEQYPIFFAEAVVAAAAIGVLARPVLLLEEEPEVEGQEQEPPDMVDAAEEPEDVCLPPLRTTLFWRELSRSPASAAAISEWIKLAQLVLVQVHGSCEDERAFSAMSYLKNKYRNRLGEPHLNVAARFFHQQWFTLNNFPYSEALDIWNAGAPIRGRYSRN
jgi:hypothetical protein